LNLPPLAHKLSISTQKAWVKMPLVAEFPARFEFEVTQGFLDFLTEHRIQTTHGPSHRWKVGDRLNCAKDCRLRSHVLMWGAPHIIQMDVFSTCLSALNIFCEIGRYCSIAPNVSLMGAEYVPDFVTTSDLVYRRDGIFAQDLGPEWKFLPNPHAGGQAKIGNDVWIGQNVLIKNGVTIGTGSVIAAGAVVVKDVLPYEIVEGVPAKHSGFRFEYEIIYELLALEWWKYRISDLPKLSWGLPSDFVKELRHLKDEGELSEFSGELGLVRDLIAQTD
jgi:virginiamycin A acetyltransferase